MAETKKTRPRRAGERGGISLTARVEDALERSIRAGAYTFGSRLPTEQEMVASFGVSRTVVREALARLHAKGLVEARQGAGVFVTERPAPVGLGLGTANMNKVSTILEVLEFRTAVEIEAAGLAAERRSMSQEMRIREAYDEMSARIERGENAAESDFAFHLAIAEATSNRLFAEFLRGLGGRTIPRAQLGGGPDLDYLRKVQREHAGILHAIAEGAPDAARRAMREHLAESQRRYRALIRG